MGDQMFCEVGFALIEGHGVAQGLISELRGAAKSFFSRSLDYKLRFYRGPSATGRSSYSPLGATQKHSTHSDPVEGYTFVRDRFGKWNTGDIHPVELAGIGERYAYEVERVMHVIHRMSATALGLDPGFFDPFYTTPANILVLSHYPPLRPLNVPDGKLRYRAHSDYTGFTILLQDEEDHDGLPGGLEIDVNGFWVPIRPKKGCYVVNIGDLFELWTNDRWRSTPHRVSSPPVKSSGANRSRITAMLFSGPHQESTIEPIYTCVDADNPSRYSAMKASDHLRRQFATQSKEAEYR